MALTTEQSELVKTILPDFEVTDETTLDQVNEAFGKSYIKMDLHESEKNRIYASATAKAENRLRKVLGSEAGDKKYDEMVETLEAKLAANAADLEAARAEVGKGGKSTPELEKLLHDKAQMDAALKDAADKLKALESEKESLKSESETKLQKYILDNKVKSLYEGVSWTKETDLYKKNGIWMAEVEGKVTFKEEDGEVIVYDATGDNWLKDGVGKMTAQKYFVSVAEKAQALKKNGATNETLESQKRAEGLPLRQAEHIERMKRLSAAQGGK
jgi:hypothetical protein